MSSSKQIFDEAAPHYQEALDRCGFNHKLEYRNGISQKKSGSRNRSRKIIWFNPPFSKSVSTNVAKEFLSLVDKHFSENRKFKKIFNRNNLKVSYSCMRNIKSIVSAHNRKVLTEESQENERKCNCPTNTTCPLDANCLSRNTMYSGKVTSNLPDYGATVYVGISEPEWK